MLALLLDSDCNIDTVNAGQFASGLSGSSFNSYVSETPIRHDYSNIIRMIRISQCSYYFLRSLQKRIK